MRPSQCTYRCVVLPDQTTSTSNVVLVGGSQCTYRCVVLPDEKQKLILLPLVRVSMHLQVRGAP